MSKANNVNERRDGTGQVIRRETWPATIDGNVQTEEWQLITPATYDLTDPDNPIELTPDVFGFVVIDGPRPLTQQERDDFEAAEAADERQAARQELRAELQTMRDTKSDHIDRKNDAATLRDEMDWYTDPPNPARLSRWKPVDEAADEPFADRLDLDAWQADIEARVDDQAKLLNLVVAELRRTAGDVRTLSAAGRDETKTVINILKSSLDDLTPAEVAGDGTDGD